MIILSLPTTSTKHNHPHTVILSEAKELDICIYVRVVSPIEICGKIQLEFNNRKLVDFRRFTELHRFLSYKTHAIQSLASSLLLNLLFASRSALFPNA